MKKNWLSLLLKMLCLCLCFTFLLGSTNCGASGGGSGGESGESEEDPSEDEEPDEDDEESDDRDADPKLLSGAKVLSRPEDYDFDEALGGYSENFFNIFARSVMNYLYELYARNDTAADYYTIISRDIDYTEVSDPDLQDKLRSWKFEKYTAEAPNKFAIGQVVDQETQLNEDGKQLYFRDSIRYTITNETTESDTQTIILNTNQNWKWGKTINEDITIFSGLDGITVNPTDSNGKISVIVDLDAIGFDDWKLYNRIKDLGVTEPSIYYGYLYTAAASPVYKEQVEGENVVDFYKSPAYNPDSEVWINYYQDALEYVAYLTALGYNREDDAAFFDFEIPAALKTGSDSPILVGGWGANRINIKDALENVKEKYKATTNYIGLAYKDMIAITDFILDEVIGPNSPNSFELNGNTYYRNYGASVYNIIKHVCMEVPIGGRVVDGAYQKVTLANGFLTSKITDYAGDAFSISENDDEMFEKIEAAEYQSIVFFPRSTSLGTRLGNVHLMFEYYELATGSTRVIDEENGLTINIGFRYYDSVNDVVIEAAAYKFTIKYGKNGIISDPSLPEPHSACDDDVMDVIIGEDEESDTKFSQEIIINTRFDNNIGGGAINAFANGQGTGADSRYILLSGTTEAKDYYKLNDSSSYGQYGTLNEEKFRGVCDFMEVYFDIEKDKDNAANKSYAFKVAATIYPMDDEIEE